jgi:hypothetical protein
MRLVQLTLHYLSNQPERLRVVTRGTEVPGEEEIGVTPRMLAFIDVPPGTMLLPQAAELDRGRVVTFFDALTERLQRDRDKPRAPRPRLPAGTRPGKQGEPSLLSSLLVQGRAVGADGLVHHGE